MLILSGTSLAQEQSASTLLPNWYIRATENALYCSITRVYLRNTNNLTLQRNIFRIPLEQRRILAKPQVYRSNYLICYQRAVYFYDPAKRRSKIALLLRHDGKVGKDRDDNKRRVVKNYVLVSSGERAAYTAWQTNTVSFIATRTILSSRTMFHKVTKHWRRKKGLSKGYSACLRTYTTSCYTQFKW